VERILENERVKSEKVAMREMEGKRKGREGEVAKLSKGKNS
jgi:hypothetical protein